MFTTALGSELDSANVRRDLRRALGLVPGWTRLEWTPRELRHSFVSVLSDAGVPVEQISQLVGHRGRRSPNSSTGTSCGPSSDRCDSDGSALQSARRKRVAVCGVTQSVTQQPGRGSDGPDYLIWLGGA